jgi:hypothetical protein
MSRALFVLRGYRWCAAGVALLFLAGELYWFGSLLTPPSPGSMEDVFTQVRIGMAQDEAVRILKTYHDPLDYDCASAAQRELAVDAASGECVEVVIGTNGRVIAKHYSSDLFWEEWRAEARSLLAR